MARGQKAVKTRFKAMISVYRNITPGVNFRVQNWKEACMAVIELRCIYSAQLLYCEPQIGL